MTKNPWKLSTILLALALAFALGLPIMRDASAQKRPQPHMRAALTATKTAIRQLEKAAHDKGGHRAAALVHLEKAKEQIVKGLDAGNPPASR
jgi:hypothetical protein